MAPGLELPGGAATAAAAAAEPLVFALNGTRVELANIDPAMTLLTYLRTQTTFRGTKCGCGEGGCGACVVFLSRYNRNSKRMEEMTINSCLTLLGSIDRCAITTTEGLGNQRTGLHPIHERLSGFHASQCGYCTPGMTMAIYGCLRKCVPATTHEPYHEIGHEKQRGLSGLTDVDAERAVSGNICRCTGYRPILDACKSFASNVDLEDLGINEFTRASKGGSLPPYDASLDPVFPQFLLEEIDASERHVARYQAWVKGATGNASAMDASGQVRFRHVESGAGGAYTQERLWITATKMEEVFDAMAKYEGERKVKLVVGNTSAGYYKHVNPEVFIDISQVPELLSIDQDAYAIEVGAAISLAKLIDLLENFQPTKDESHLHDCENGFRQAEGTGVDSIALALASHLKKVATGHVRNRGSVGGNLIIAQQFQFPSDIATILLGAGASVKCLSKRGNHVLLEESSLEDFLAKGIPGSGCVLQSVRIPLTDWHKSNKGDDTLGNSSCCSRVMFKTFRASPRPLGNALAYVNAAFFARVSTPKEEEGNNPTQNVIEEGRFAFGAFGTKHAIRAHGVEKFLSHKAVTPSVVLEALRLLKIDVVPSTETSKAEYRVSVAVAFLFEFLRPFLGAGAITIPKNIKQEKSVKKWQHKNQLLNKGKQTFTPLDDNYPVGQPVPKMVAELQASGEATYVDDIPSPENCLHGAFVYSQEAFAKVQHIDLKAALESAGIVTYVSAQDVPPGGKNVLAASIVHQEPLFATDVVEYVGHLLGVVVADTAEHAQKAAAKVIVGYDTTTVGPPVLSIEDAINQNSYHQLHWLALNSMYPVGDIVKGFAGADLIIEGAEVSTNSQKHFYMETQATLVIPDEDGCMLVYCSTQCPSYVQQGIAACLGLPMHNIRVITRRVGGGFGGKVTRCLPLAVSCALAAYKLKQPVRMVLDRNTDMVLTGGRSLTHTKFKVGFTKEGKILALQAQIFWEAGFEPDFSTMFPSCLMRGLRKYDWGAMDIDLRVCKTNKVPTTAFRGPGHTQGSFIADAIVERVASELGMDADEVRERNLHTSTSLGRFYGPEITNEPEFVDESGEYTLPKLWARLKASAKWEERKQQVERFNAENIWIKQGLAMVPCIYMVSSNSNVAKVSIYSDGSIVAEVGGIEIGQGLYTKVRQMIAFSLSQLWSQGRGVDMSKIRIAQADTISMANTGMTSDSTTSEGSCAAVRAASQMLVARLRPIKEKLEKEGITGELPWETLIAQAAFAADLTAYAQWTPDAGLYLLFGVAACEVEINVLTGERSILATDLIYDCGKSLNPAVDIGQVEGAFVQGIGFFMTEDVEMKNGTLVSDGTWTYKVPTVDTIPQRFHVELYNGPAHQHRVLSSKAVGEPPLLLAGSVHMAIQNAIKAARKENARWCAQPNVKEESKLKNTNIFRLDTPATVDRIKLLCGLDNVESYLEALVRMEQQSNTDSSVKTIE